MCTNWLLSFRDILHIDSLCSGRTPMRWTDGKSIWKYVTKAGNSIMWFCLFIVCLRKRQHISIWCAMCVCVCMCAISVGLFFSPYSLDTFGNCCYCYWSMHKMRILKILRMFIIAMANRRLHLILNEFNTCDVRSMHWFAMHAKWISVQWQNYTTFKLTHFEHQVIIDFNSNASAINVPVFLLFYY